MTGETLPSMQPSPDTIKTEDELKTRPQNELLPLYEIETERYIFVPLGRVSDLIPEAKGSIGENAEPLSKIKAEQIESAADPYSRITCCIDGRLRHVAEKVKDSVKRTFNITKRAASNPIKLAGGEPGIAYSGVLAGINTDMDKDNHARKLHKDTYKNILKPLKLRGSTHSDQHADGPKCGCGACDNLKATNTDIKDKVSDYDALYRNLHSLAPNILPRPEQADRNSVKYHATKAAEEDAIPTGKDLTRSHKRGNIEIDPDLDYDEAQIVVTAGHNEELLGFWMDEDTCVDKNKLPFQGFFVDIGPFSKEVKNVFNEDDGIHSKRNANRLIYSTVVFNLATGKQLGHKDLPVYAIFPKKTV